LGAGAIGAGASVISANSTKNAAENTAAANNALAAQIYGSNKEIESPFIQTGQAANANQASFFSNGQAPGLTTMPTQISGLTQEVGAPQQGKPLSGVVNVNGKQVYIGDQPPPNPSPGQTWLTPSGQLNVYDGGEARWAQSGADSQTASQWLGGATPQQALQQAQQQISAPVAGPTNPGLQSFESAAGLSGPQQAIANTLGSNEGQFLTNTGQAAPTNALASQLGSTFGEYLGNSGVQPTLSAEDALLGTGGAARSISNGIVNVGGKQITIGDQAPANPTSGTPWIDQGGTLHVWDQSSGRWAQPNADQQAQWLGGQNVQQVLSQAQQQQGAGDSGFGKYLANTGLQSGLDANDNLLGLRGNGGYQGFLSNTGLDKTNQATSDFLGLGQGGNGLADFLGSTGYKFNLQTGSDAAASNAASRGLLNSGSTLKALDQYGQQLGQTYGQAYLSNLGSYGQQLQGQGTAYSDLVNQRNSAQNGLAQNYLSDLSGRAAQQQGLNQDYLSGQSSLASLKAGQAQNYLSGQTGLYGLNSSGFGTYFGSQNDLANRGLSAANALAGVGTNYVNQVTGNNNNALGAVSGANASIGNNINGLLGNALSAYGYNQGFAPSSSWGAAAYQGFGIPSSYAGLV